MSIHFQAEKVRLTVSMVPNDDDLIFNVSWNEPHHIPDRGHFGRVSVNVYGSSHWHTLVLSYTTSTSRNVQIRQILDTLTMIHKPHCPVLPRALLDLFEEHFGSRPRDRQTWNVRITGSSLACAIWIRWVTGCGRVTWVLDDDKMVRGNGKE